LTAICFSYDCMSSVCYRLVVFIFFRWKLMQRIPWLIQSYATFAALVHKVPLERESSRRVTRKEKRMEYVQSSLPSQSSPWTWMPVSSAAGCCGCWNLQFQEWPLSTLSGGLARTCQWGYWGIDEPTSSPDSRHRFFSHDRMKKASLGNSGCTQNGFCLIICTLNGSSCHCFLNIMKLLSDNVDYQNFCWKRR
jgi:hypothetical protein